MNGSSNYLIIESEYFAIPLKILKRSPLGERFAYILTPPQIDEAALIKRRER